MINAGMVFSDRHYGGINYPRGGVGIIAEKLVKGIENYGGEIRYKSKVKKILFREGKAIGVSLDNDEEIYGKTIVSNATRWDTFGGQGINEPLVELDKTPRSETKWQKRYSPSPSFLSLHLGVTEDSIPSKTHCHHLHLDTWEKMEQEQGVTFVSIPTLLDPTLAPPGRHIIHAFTPSSIDYWEGLSNKEYLEKKKNDANKLILKLEKLFPNLNQHIIHKEIGSPKTHKRFLSRNKGSYGPIPLMRLPGLLPMPFNTTKIKGLYCVGDSCFPGQGLNAVAFSGYACAHIIGAKLGINKWKLPE
tara:strand:+ start:1 stop:909 length:909 start_codon:yes stop_codon:yes gene_type:complete